MTLVAGVDSSTQSCKVLIVDAYTGEIVRQGRASHPDGTEVHPNAWWRAFCEAVEQAGGLSDVEAISIGGQQHGLVALNSQGQVVRDALLWNDTRSAAAAAELISEIGAKEYVARTGLLPVASFTAAKLRWLRDAEPDLVPNIAAVCLPHDWLTWKLRGYGSVEESPLGPQLEQLVTDRSEVSGTAYWSVFSERYDFELFHQAFGRPAVEANFNRGSETTSGEPDAVILPRVMKPDESTLVDAIPQGLLGIKSGLIVAPGCGDNAGAMLGLGAGPGDFVISIGTSGTVFTVSAEAVSDVTGTVAGFADASGKYLPLVATLNAARILDAVAKLLRLDHVSLSDLALSAKPGSEGIVMFPFFEGERTPNLPDATARVVGLTLSNATADNLARAAVEGMICGLADGLDVVRHLGINPRRILLIGGGAQSKAVPHIASEIFGLKVVVPVSTEYVARGAARQAAWSFLGEIPNWKLAVASEIQRDPQPQVRSAYRSAFERQVWQ